MMSGEPAKTSATFCSMLWNHVFVSPQGDCKPCCRFSMKERAVGEPVEVFHSQLWDDIREKMKDGQRVAGCQRCYQEEASGKKSLRQRYNKRRDIGIDSVNTDRPGITWIEVPLSNRCNLACRMCDSRYSTRWIKEEKSMSGQSRGIDRVVELAWPSLAPIASQLRHVKITGGEPLMDPNHKQFLKMLIEKGVPQNIYLNYSTNLSIFPDDEVNGLWKEFKAIELALSLDSSRPDELNYLRFPLSAEDALENIGRFMELADRNENISLILRATVSLFNIDSVPETLQYWANKMRQHVHPDNWHRIQANPTHLTFPEYLSAQVLPQEIKEWVIENFESYNVEDPYILQATRELHRYMLASDQSRRYPEFLKKTSQLDQLRGQRFQSVFPFLEGNLE